MSIKMKTSVRALTGARYYDVSMSFSEGKSHV